MYKFIDIYLKVFNKKMLTMNHTHNQSLMSTLFTLYCLHVMSLLKYHSNKRIPCVSGMVNLASAHNLNALSKAALKYAHENVETVLQSQEFLKSPITQVGVLQTNYI